MNSHPAVATVIFGLLHSAAHLRRWTAHRGQAWVIVGPVGDIRPSRWPQSCWRLNTVLMIGTAHWTHAFQGRRTRQESKGHGRSNTIRQTERRSKSAPVRGFDMHREACFRWSRPTQTQCRTFRSSIAPIALFGNHNQCAAVTGLQRFSQSCLGRQGAHLPHPWRGPIEF